MKAAKLKAIDTAYFSVDDAWISTYTGAPAYPLQPERTEYNIRTIAHSLGMQCRWNGHCFIFYSVGQHSCYAHDFIEPPLTGDTKMDALVEIETRLAALMHDATETYLCDVPRPLKGHLGDYKKIESATDIQINKVFNIDVTPEIHKAVKRVDDLLLIREAFSIMPKPSRPWAFEGHPDPLKSKLPIIFSWTPAKAEEEFLKRFERLMVLKEQL